jgi:sugar O-acyltransferase (sialic acid O-acetyltransferase NeuD family)
MAKLKQIIIFGAGRGSRDVLQLIRQINARRTTWDILGFIDPDDRLQGKTIDGYPVIDKKKIFQAKEIIYGVTGIQLPYLRKQIVELEIEGQGFQLASLIHPGVDVPDDMTIGKGCVIYPGVIIASNVRLGKSVLVNYQSLLGIDLVVGDYSFIGPHVNITASCSIGRESVIGASAVFVPGVSVGDRSVIGLGTKLLAHVGNDQSVMDLPQKLTKNIVKKTTRVSL